jgi:DNA-binding response OmpR family regulator
MADILLIDDDADLRGLYTLALENAGYSVTAASDGQEGLDLASRGNVDLILLDLNMPVLDGFGFLEAYHLSDKPNVKCIILTNADDVELVNKAMQMGVSNYIEKVNVTPMEMTKIVAGVLGNQTV